MPKLNKTIIRSIVQDLKSLEKICNELHKYVHNTETMSWRYPPQMCHSIHINSILNEYKGSAYECYLLVLELMYDRFQYFLHLIIKFLDMIPLIPQTFDSPRNVVSPEYLSTGALLNMLWARFQILQKYIMDLVVRKASSNDGHNAQNVTLSLGALLSQSISTPAPTNYQSHSFNRNTQTESCSFMKCESCSISEDLVKFVIHEVQKQCVEYEMQSKLSHKRESMKGKIFHITQWGAMTNWSDAIKKDLQEIFQTFSQQTNSNKELQKSLTAREHNLEEIHLEMVHEMENLKDKLCNLENQLQMEKKQANCLAYEKEELNLNLKNQIEENQHLSEDLKSSANSLTQTIKTCSILEIELKKIAHEFGVDISSIEDYKNILEKWKFFASNSENEKRNIKNELQILKTKFHENENYFKKELEQKEAIIKEEKDKQDTKSLELHKMKECVSECQYLRQQNEQLQFNLNESVQKIMSLVKITENLEKELEIKRTQQQLLIENPDVSTKVEVKVHGDPELDLENQIQANEIRIQLLSAQTSKLKETLSKFRKLTKFRQTALSTA